jgi:flagellar biosynthesis protein FlhA
MLGTITEKLGAAKKFSEAYLALAVVGMVLLLVIPLSPLFLDFFLSISIILAVITLLITLYTEEPLDFNSFPSLLLFLTLFRLGLNIASTRMILTEAEAGDIIQTFGQFVTGGNQVVGVIIFILLTVINFVVITKGSGRVAEVAARFTLDAMPGKQMAIDADLNAGIIDEQEAKFRREKITREADFYGSMDGASKFVRGDAIAGIIITIVNVIGGFIIGVAMKGMQWEEAIETYVTLSVGDGLVSQIPALLISVGAGIIVTRATSKENLGKTFSRQLFNDPRVLFVTAFIVAMLSLVPGMPMLIMLPIAAAIAMYAQVIQKSLDAQAEQVESGIGTVGDKTSEKGGEEDVEKVLFVDPMEIELGYGLIALVDQNQGGDLLNRITLIRRQIASELGIVVPPIRIRDNMSFNAERYLIKIKGIEVASGSLYVDSFLAMNPGGATRKLTGIETVEPAFGLPATWISAAQKESAEMHGYTVVDALSVLATHLTEVIHQYAHELINRQEASRLIDNAKQFASAVIEELIPNQLTVGQVLKVLQNLLRERISVRDIVTVLEALADHSVEIKDPEVLTEHVRKSLARTISKQHADDKMTIRVITLDPKVEQMMIESLQKSDYGTRIVLRPNTIQKITAKLAKFAEDAANEGVNPVVLVSPMIRAHLKRLIEKGLPRLSVLSFNEVVPEMDVESIGTVSSDVLM